MNVRSLVFTMQRVGEQKGVGLYVCNSTKCKSAKSACSIRIQQYVGIITCMGLVLLRANEKTVHVGKKGIPECHIIWCVPYMVYHLAIP